MSKRSCSRPGLALLAAYAVALQTILLAFAGPVASASDVFAAPICAHSGAGGNSPPPAGHGCDCLANCLAGCCGAVAAPAPGTAVIHAPGPLRTLDAAAAPPQLGASTAVAYRPRAPPLG